MEKITFTNTTITKKPYVVINGVEYEVQDGTYTGGTDLDANTFNTMQDNIEKAINSLYPIGTIIIRDENLDMSSWLGFTWEKVFAGRVLVGLDTSQTEFNTIGKTGGEKTHKLTINEMPSHNHPGIFRYTNQTGDYSRLYLGSDGTALANEGKTGGDQPHNNLQPYQVVAYWKRTA